MRVSYDVAADALFIFFSDGTSVDSEEMREGVIADVDADGKVVAIEVLNASKVLDLANLREESIPLVLSRPLCQ
jgi:uncharacterized protein YuzE